MQANTLDNTYAHIVLCKNHNGNANYFRHIRWQICSYLLNKVLNFAPSALTSNSITLKGILVKSTLRLAATAQTAPKGVKMNYAFKA